MRNIADADPAFPAECEPKPVIEFEGSVATYHGLRLTLALGILFIACEVLGDALKIVIGALIAFAVVVYVASEWKEFDEIARMEADGASSWRSFMN